LTKSVLYIYDSLKADTVFSVPSVSVEQIKSAGPVAMSQRRCLWMSCDLCWQQTVNHYTQHHSQKSFFTHTHTCMPHFQPFFLQFVSNQIPLLTFPGSSSHLWTQYKYKCVISNSYVYKGITTMIAIFWSSKSLHVSVICTSTKFTGRCAHCVHHYSTPQARTLSPLLFPDRI